MTCEDVFALFAAPLTLHDDDPDWERLEARRDAALKLHITMRDWPAQDRWIVPALLEGDDALQERAAETLAARFQRRIVRPDSGEGSAWLVTADWRDDA